VAALSKLVETFYEKGKIDEVEMKCFNEIINEIKNKSQKPQKAKKQLENAEDGEP
jgi:polyhydroxyalkanoate synthesis regulator phasin